MSKRFARKIIEAWKGKGAGALAWTITTSLRRDQDTQVADVRPLEMATLENTSIRNKKRSEPVATPASVVGEVRRLYTPCADYSSSNEKPGQ